MFNMSPGDLEHIMKSIPKEKSNVFINFRRNDAYISYRSDKDNSIGRQFIKLGINDYSVDTILAQTNSEMQYSLKKKP